MKEIIESSPLSTEFNNFSFFFSESKQIWSERSTFWFHRRKALEGRYWTRSMTPNTVILLSMPAPLSFPHHDDQLPKGLVDRQIAKKSQSFRNDWSAHSGMGWIESLWKPNYFQQRARTVKNIPRIKQISFDAPSRLHNSLILSKSTENNKTAKRNSESLHGCDTEELSRPYWVP